MRWTNDSNRAYRSTMINESVKYAVVLTPLIPLRSNPEESAEQDTQLLFGELVTIQRVEGRWCLITNHNDNYNGWVDPKMLTPISESEFHSLISAPKAYISAPIAIIEHETVEQSNPGIDQCSTIHLTYGSILPGYNPNNSTLQVAGEIYKLSKTDVTYPVESTNEAFVASAMKLQGAPYLWGGKSLLGCDCSGLTQVAASLVGISLPRNASQQAEIGEKIENLQKAKRGDLLFFATSDNKVKHVAILLTPSTILHASGTVHIDTINENGDIESKITTYSHYKLHSIRRVAR
ncbi:MAG: NlpC/P60 family protein [Bacteroidales bacterium]